jgi:hypothetical protein
MEVMMGQGLQQQIEQWAWHVQRLCLCRRLSTLLNARSISKFFSLSRLVGGLEAFVAALGLEGASVERG